MMNNSWLLASSMFVLLVACGGAPAPTSTPTLIPTQTPAPAPTPTPDLTQPYLEAVASISNESSPYVDQLLILVKKSAYPSEIRPLLVKVAAISAKFRSMKVPERFRIAHDYLNAYSLNVENALKALDENDISWVNNEMKSANSNLKQYTLLRDAVLAAGQR